MGVLTKDTEALLTRHLAAVSRRGGKRVYEDAVSGSIAKTRQYPRRLIDNTDLEENGQILGVQKGIDPGSRPLRTRWVDDQGVPHRRRADAVHASASGYVPTRAL